MATRSPLSPSQEGAVRSVLRIFPLRDQTLVLLGLHTGFRIHELLSIRVDQVWTGTEVRESLRVERSALKGGKGAFRRRVTSRRVPLHPNAAEAIQAYLEQRLRLGPLPENTPLFPSRKHGQVLSPSQASRVIGRILASAGLSESANWGTHSLRKTFARRVYEQSGNDIALTRCALGHRSITTTQQYLGFSESDAAQIIKNLRPADKQAPASTPTEERAHIL
jgi:integrase